MPRIRPDRRGGNRNILITGINYRPEVTGIAPYTSNLAEHFAAIGHRLTVIIG